MLFPAPLKRGRLVKRYKRFLADVVLDEGGETITASCPNTGSMLGLSEPGMAVWVSENDSPTRKYRHTLELVEADAGAGPTLVGINTGLPNRIVREAIQAGTIPALAGYRSLRNEVRYGVNSRIDILLEDPARDACYVEVKNVHLMRAKGVAEFPDSVTERGAKHLDELAGMVEAGHRAVMVFLIQRGDATRFSLAGDIDPDYVAAFAKAKNAGVESVAVRCRIEPAGIFIDAVIEVAA